MGDAKAVNNFYDLETWQKAHKLALDIYRVTKNFPRDEIYGITSQLRRAAASITANIAEGFSRYHYNDKIKFYYNSRGSISEVQNFLMLSLDLGYIDKKKTDEILKESEAIMRLINGLIRSIEKQKSL